MDNYFSNKCNQNAENISFADGGIMDMAEVISTHDEAIKELAGVVSDMIEKKGEI